MNELEPSTNSLNLPTFYSSNASSVFEGLREKIEYNTRIYQISTVVFAASLVTTTIAATFSGVVPLILTGLGLLVAIASIVKAIAHKNGLFASEKWEQTFKSILMWNPEKGAEELRKVVQQNWESNGRDTSDGMFFIKDAISGFDRVDASRNRYGGEEGFLPSFVRMLLIADLKIIQNGKDDAFEATFRKDLKLLKACAQHQRCGPTEQQKAIFKLSELSWEEIKQEAQKIRLPTEISVGYGMMVGLIYHLERFKTTSKVFDERGKFLYPQYERQYGTLKEWKTTNERACIWLKKERKYEGEIASLIEGIQQAKTEKECCEIVQALTEEKIKEFENQTEQ